MNATHAKVTVSHCEDGFHLGDEFRPNIILDHAPFIRRIILRRWLQPFVMKHGWIPLLWASRSFFKQISGYSLRLLVPVAESHSPLGAQPDHLQRCGRPGLSILPRYPSWPRRSPGQILLARLL